MELRETTDSTPASSLVFVRPTEVVGAPETFAGSGTEGMSLFMSVLTWVALPVGATLFEGSLFSFAEIFPRVNCYLV